MRFLGRRKFQYVVGVGPTSLIQLVLVLRKLLFNDYLITGHVGDSAGLFCCKGNNEFL